MNQEELFLKIERDMAPYMGLLSDAADTILDEKVSSYPIFVIHQLEVEIGIALLGREAAGSNWNVHASTLEELAAKRIVAHEKVDDFRDVYKDPEAYLCLLLLTQQGAQFIFLPRKHSGNGRSIS